MNTELITSLAKEAGFDTSKEETLRQIEYLLQLVMLECETVVKPRIDHNWKLASGLGMGHSGIYEGMARGSWDALEEIRAHFQIWEN